MRLYNHTVEVRGSSPCAPTQMSLIGSFLFFETYRFESRQNHKKQVILPEKKARSPTIMASCRKSEEPLTKSGGSFVFRFSLVLRKCSK